MKYTTTAIFLYSSLLFAQPRELIPYSKTDFSYINKKGIERDIDMTGQDFIFVSVREEDSDGRFYAVDRDGTVWLSGGISSGEEVGFTPSGKWNALYKKRYYTSKTYPEEDGSNNMDYSIFFTNWGHALHKGSIDNTSHGCIHVQEHDIVRLFRWVNIGMPILVSRHRFMQFARPDLKKIYSQERKYTRRRGHH
jgi:hypothetical protein